MPSRIELPREEALDLERRLQGLDERERSLVQLVYHCRRGERSFVYMGAIPEQAMQLICAWGYHPANAVEQKTYTLAGNHSGM